MPGFSRMEQQRLARIVLAHRGNLGKMQDAGLEGSDWTLVFALRIAALVLRNRTDARFPMLRVEGDKSGYSIDLPQAWLEENPLAAAALETESRHWEAVDLRCTVNSLSEKKVAQLRG
jgi:exopolyphosphatase/guanosine-5'-triphosphate,3'-diphosphate pyrophosphatase